MKTIWKKSISKFNKLNKNISCNTVIIGGGIAGLWCAYHLVKAGHKVCILEAKRIGSGVTSGSSAILTHAQELLYDTLIKKHGEEVSKQYLNHTKNSISKIVNIINEEKINCNLSATDFVLFSTKNSGANKLSKEKTALQKLGDNPEWVNSLSLPYEFNKAFKVDGSYLIDPLMLISGLTDYVVKNGAQIFENTMVTSQPDGKLLEVNGFKIEAENFIVATHFPYINFPGFYFLKMHQDRNYSIVFQPNKSQKEFAKRSTYECIDKNGFEYRQVGNNVLCLGPDIRTGTKPYKSNYQIIENHLKNAFLITRK